jgi:hypothetical protein
VAQPFIWGAKTTFYKNPNGLFSTRPGETKSLQNIKRFGPVGMGIDLLQPAFVMRISNIEEGSPAAVTGKLKKGQIIESIPMPTWPKRLMFCSDLVSPGRVENRPLGFL